MENARFRFSCNQSDVQFMKELVKKVFSLPRMALIAAITCLTVLMLYLSIDGSESTYPLLIFSSIIAFGFLYFFISTLIERPAIMRRIDESEGSVYDLFINGAGLALSINGEKTIPFGIKAIRNQFWQGERYCLHIDCKVLHTFICIPVNEDTFDNLYALANGLEKHRKRLIVINGRRS